MRLRICCLLFLILFCKPGFGQVVIADSTFSHKNSFINELIVPAGLLVSAALLGTGNIRDRLQDAFPRTSTRVDDILQYVPVFQMIAYDALNIRHRNSIFDQSKYLLVSQAATGAVVHLLKTATHMERPNGGLHSFPSRHTSVAFGTATALWFEFREDNPILAGSGFFVATATGILRVTNNAHWVPDVLAGAGIGILMTSMVYRLEPFKNWQLGGKQRKIAVVPEFRDTGLNVRFIF